MKLLRWLIYAFAGLGLYFTLVIVLYHDADYLPPPNSDARCINSACTCLPAKHKFIRHAGCKE
jgi:hypothetical protein